MTDDENFAQISSVINKLFGILVMMGISHDLNFAQLIRDYLGRNIGVINIRYK